MGSTFSHDLHHERRERTESMCNTRFENGWKMQMGFVAGKTFYETNEFEGHLSKCTERACRFYSYLDDDSDDSLTAEFYYNSFLWLNIDVKDSYIRSDNGSDIVQVEIVCVVKYTPTFDFQLPDNSEVVYWNDLIKATAFKITCNIDSSNFDSWKNKLISRLRCPATYNRMIHEEYLGPSDPDLFDVFISKLPKDARDYVDCIESRGLVGEYLIDYYLFEQNDVEMLKEYRRTYQWDRISEYFASMFKFLKRDISLPSLNFDPRKCPVKRQRLNFDDRHGTRRVTVKTAYVTPTKILFDAEEYTDDCRGFRKLGHEKILQVKFVDENGSRFPRDEKLLNERMLSTLTNGISFGGKRYFDFGCSPSFFKQHGAYFFEAHSQQEIIDIINEWGEFEIEHAAKVYARLGLFFSSGRQIQKKLRYDQIGILPEIVCTPENPDEPKYIFSDGIGIIDISFAKKIQRELGIPYTPSAFQFRCISCKGMVAVDPHNKDLVSNGGQYLVMFRKSQSKFTAPTEAESDFDVVRYSGPAPLRLHKNFIAFLIALARRQGKLEVVENRLHELFTQSMVEILEPLYNPYAFAKALNKLPKHFPLKFFSPEQLFKQDFLRSVVEVNAVNLCKQMNNKFRISIPESLGRQALGVIDETGLLGPGEIFFQYTNDIRSKASNPSRTVLSGKVGVTKSPMYHMSDIRYLVAVDYPQLLHHVDVVVFSRHGRRPIPDQIGGGDLDGDCYDIFWDPAFLMEHSEPVLFPSLKPCDRERVTIQELHHRHAEFRVKFELENNLDEISNCFLSHIVLHHPDHPEVEALSEKADIAVNTSKSGIFAPAVSYDEWPIFNSNFMNKRHEPMFDCDHVLSQLYKRITRMYLMMQVSQDDAQKRRRMKFPQSNVKATKHAEEMYEKYSNELTKLMRKFGIKTEAELFTSIVLDPIGNFNTFKSVDKDDDSSRTTLIKRMVSDVVNGFRTKILDRFKVDWWEDKKEKGESFAAYCIPDLEIPMEMRIWAKQFQALSEGNGKFLSFQYLVAEALDFDFHYGDEDGSETIDKLLVDFANDDNSLDDEELMVVEGDLIQLSFSSSAFDENVLHDIIISYPSFVVSVPVAYSDKFRNNCEILKEISGCRDVAIRFKKDTKSYHHYEITCRGTIESCITLEKKLTPYVHFDETMTISFEEMKQLKTRRMKELLDDIEMLCSTQIPDQILHSFQGPVRRNSFSNEDQSKTRYHPYSRFSNSNRRRRHSWR